MLSFKQTLKLMNSNVLRETFVHGNDEIQVNDYEVRGHTEEFIEMFKNKCFYFNSYSDHFGKWIVHCILVKISFLTDSI